jgi:glucose-1-phosphate adenylyltransferase
VGLSGSFEATAVAPPYARHAMAVVLCGGRGSRLMELTDLNPKSAVPFGGKSRIIDFALSNALNSGIRRIAVATQYRAHSLISHLQRGWNFFRPERNESFDILPASQRVSETMWYLGTADAVYQNIDIIESYGPQYIVVLAGDHIYKMDYEELLREHVESGADVTVGCLEAPLEEAKGLGVMRVNPDDRILSFCEKPGDPLSMPGRPNAALCSMGIYAFESKLLISELRRDAADRNSSHDFGNDIIPSLVAKGVARAHHFSRSCVVSRDEADVYWRDVATVDAYWAANIDLTDTVPHLDLYDRDWPIWTYGEITPPTKFVHDEDGRRGTAVSSLLSGGCIVSGGAVSRSLISTGVRIHSYSTIHETVILPHARIGRHARLRRVVVGCGALIPEGLVVGEDPALDAKRFRRTEGGVTLITQPMLDRLAL